MDDLINVKPIILTGGRGCLAGVLGSYLESRGADVTRLSRVAGEGCQSLEDFFLGRVSARGGTVLHLAWSTLPYSAEQNPGMEQVNDLPLMKRLLEKLATLAERERPHVIFFSSGGSVYGDTYQGRPHREDAHCKPIGRHGQAKLAAEQLLEQTANRLGLSWSILRVSNPYGFPVPANRSQGIIPVAIKAAHSGQPLTIWGDGTARKDFLHHSDFSRAVGQIIQQQSTGTFNLCSGESHSITEILNLIEHVTGRKLAVKHVPAHPWDVHESRLDGSKLRAAIAWRPLVSLAEGIRRTIADISVA